MLRTVRHEGFHQYLDRMLPETPVWLNEGTAEYFETAVLAGGRVGASTACDRNGHGKKPRDSKTIYPPNHS
jgi:hypothetical protein